MTGATRSAPRVIEEMTMARTTASHPARTGPPGAGPHIRIVDA
jgi:hypothetical protein